VREISGAVEWIDDPSMLARLRVRPALLGEDRMGRKGVAKRPDDGLFGFVVGLSHEIDRVGLAGDLDTVQSLQMDAAGRTRGAQRHLLEFSGHCGGSVAHRDWTLFEAESVIQRAA
jgi:hypothetical protein